MRRLVVQSIAVVALGTVFTPLVWAATDFRRDHLLGLVLWAVQL